MPRILLILRRELLRQLHLRIGFQQFRLVRLLRRWMRSLKAKQRAVVDGLLSRAVPNDERAQVVSLVPEKRIVPLNVVELAVQIIELRLLFSDSSLQSGVFDDPGVKELRELLARELWALQERQRE